jgi:hypothetical protein
MSKIVASLRSVFIINAWYFQHEKPEIRQIIKELIKCQRELEANLPQRLDL